MLNLNKNTFKKNKKFLKIKLKSNKYSIKQKNKN